MQPKGSLTFPTKSIFELFCFTDSTFPGDEDLQAEENRTLWNTIVNIGVVAVTKRSIDEIIAQYLYTTRLPQVYLKEDGAHECAVKRKVLLDVWFECIAARLNSDCAHEDKLGIPRSEGSVLLTGKHFAPQCGHIDLEITTHDRCPDLS